MIEQELEQMDIAQHHALFEREMTEVIFETQRGICVHFWDRHGL